ncbi:MAG: 50S ribosomal protein L4 [archaeon]
MKAEILDINGKKTKEIELPEFFSEKIREDIVARVLEAKKKKQPYSPSLVAGKQYSASGKIKHHRHVWKTHYGKGIARIPRKIMSRRGSQFNWIGATVPSTVGGRRAHPPKVVAMINSKKINKKEISIALKSAISATANEKEVSGKYEKLRNEKLKLPIVVESKITSLKAKELMNSMKKILGGKLFDVAIKKKTIRAGKGKMRGRKYKSNAGLLIVTGNDEKMKTGFFDVVNAKNVSITDLAKGGLGRLTVYTENSIKNLKEKIK